MIYAWLLIVCPTHSYKAPCLPPQVYYSAETCQRVGNTYSKVSGSYAEVRCVQVPRKDVK